MKHMAGVEYREPADKGEYSVAANLDAEALQPVRKKHKVFDHKVLAIFFVFGLFFIVSNLVAMVAMVGGMVLGVTIDTNTLNNTIGTLAGLAILLWFQFHFRSEFEGVLNWSTLGLMLCLPAASFGVINLVEGFLEGAEANPLLPVVVMALTPGISEEVLFRVVPISNWMRVSREEKDILPCVLVTALIFGAVHSMNLISGAAFFTTLFQVAYAAALGVFFAAVFIRSGSFWPTMIMHTFIDATGFLFMDMATNGVMTDELTIDLAFFIVVVLSTILVVFGFYLVRPSKRAEIIALWDEKWAGQYELPMPQETYEPQEAYKPVGIE